MKIILLAFAVCLSSLSQVRAQLRVVTTTADLGAIVRAIGDDQVRVTALSLPSQDPHFVDARPSLALDLARADLLVAIGLGLEIGWLRTLQTGSRNSKIQNGASGFLDCSQFVQALEAPRRRVDRSMGDVHPGGSPHYMFDPRQAGRVARGIADRLTRLAPAHAAEFHQNLDAFLARLDRARRRWEARLAHLRGRKVIAYHRSFAYLADWLGFQVVDHIEPRPGIPPTPSHVAHVLDVMRSQEVHLILQERFYPQTTSKLIAERSGGAVVVLPGGPDLRRNQTYFDFIDRTVVLLEQGQPRAAP